MAEKATTSVLGKESILSVAESLGAISDDVAEAMAPEIEYRLRDIIQEARKFMIAARRETLTTADINYALRLRNLEPLYGFGNTGGTSAQLNEMPRFCRLYGAPDVFYLADREIALADVIASPFPPLPREPGVKLHWLAVDGKQPVCADNPPPRVANPAPAATPTTEPGPDALPSAKRAKSGAAAVADGAGAGGGATAVLVDSVEHVLSKEEAQLFARIVAAVRASADAPPADGGATAGARAAGPGADHLSWGQLGAAAAQGADAAAGEAGGAAAEAAQRLILGAVLRSVAAEPSSGSLAPFLAQFIGAEVSASLGKTHALRVLVRLADALLRSPERSVEHYVHQVMPALLTCTVHRKLCTSPLDNHWAVRDAAALVVARVCARFGPAYPGLQPRVTQTLLGALRDRSKPLTTHYGAIVGLAALGAHVVHGLLLPELLGGGRADDAAARAAAAPTPRAGGHKSGGKRGAAAAAPCAPPPEPPAAAARAGYIAALIPELSAPSAVRRQEAMRVYAAALAAASGYVHRHRHLFELAAGAAAPTAAILAAARAAVPADADVPMADAADRAARADEAASEPSITERALAELLPQLGVNYKHLYEHFGEAVLPGVMCEPTPTGAARVDRPAPPMPALSARKAASAPTPPAARSRLQPRMALSLLAIC